jgi:hypothetical protein
MSCCEALDTRTHKISFVRRFTNIRKDMSLTNRIGVPGKEYLKNRTELQIFQLPFSYLFL